MVEQTQKGRLPAPAAYDRERELDWLTAMVPLVLTAILRYHWVAVWLFLLAVAGYIAGTYGLSFVGGTAPRFLPALVSGLVVGLCLPATAPLWVAALAGIVASLAATVPQWIHRRWPTSPYARPLVPAALVGYLVVLWLFPGFLDGFTLPVQWDHLDGAATATPLALLEQGAPLSLSRLLWGMHAGALGDGGALGMVLGMLFLLTRRRVRLMAPAAMLLTLSMLSWMVYGAPVYSLLCGGTLLGALLLADKTYTPAGRGQQVAMGVVAGVVLVLCRRFTGGDGTAVAVVLAGLFRPLLLPLWRVCRPVWVRLWAVAGRLFGRLKEKLQKNKNNG